MWLVKLEYFEIMQETQGRPIDKKNVVGGFWFPCAPVPSTSFRRAKVNPGIKAPERQRYHGSPENEDVS